MNKFFLNFFIFFLTANQIVAQFNQAQDVIEAQDMIALCNSFTFLELYGSDTAIIPTNYTLTYTSPTLGLDNKYQIYETATSAVINLRGSTAKKISWLENFYSSMIAADDKIVIDNKDFLYQLSTDTSAHVHAGFTLGLAFIANDVVAQINKLNKNNIFNITITGHSQGGALAILLRAYLEHLPNNVISSKNKFKTYAFAHPKVGNLAFVKSYKKLCAKGSNYSIINPEDVVPKTPLSYTNTKINSIESLLKIYQEKNVRVKDIIYGKLGNLTNNKMTNTATFASKQVFNEICKSLDNAVIKMPEYKKQYNYAIMPNRIELESFEYPKIVISNNDISNEKVYQKEPSFYQHKTYNYYVAFLKMFNKKAFNKLEVKVLPENL